MDIIQQLESEQVAIVAAKRSVPDFSPGDTVIVNVNVALYLKDNWHEGGDDPTPLPEGVIVGRFAPETWTDEFVVALEKGSALTTCVNDAIDEIRRQNLINEYITEYIINTDTLPIFQ